MRDIDTTAPPATVEAMSDDDAFDALPDALPPWAVSSEAPSAPAASQTPPPPPRRSSPGRVTDDQIYAALQAGEIDGVSAAELCETYGITLPTYCVWKRKYGSLTFEELQAARRGEARRRRTFTGALAGGALVCAGSLWLFAMPARSTDTVMATPSRSASASKAERPARRPSRTKAPDAQPVVAAKRVEAPARAAAVQAPAAVPPSVQQAAPSKPAAQVPAAAPRSDAKAQSPPQSAKPQPATPQPAKPLPQAAPPLPSDDTGIVVQVMAAPTWGEAKAALDSLRSGGHRAYALAATVGNAPMYRVRVGPFDSRRAAGQAIRDLERDGYQQPWIVR